MANGEKRLFSLINATVSHEMRNPTNSMLAQVNEQKLLNRKLKETINFVNQESNLKIKESLSRINNRQTNSTNIQFTAVKLLNFIINDMLDYAQLNAGKFRKQLVRFDLVESISEVLDIMKFKAD